MSFINYNGKLIKQDEPIVVAANRGLRYGDGLFETMRWQQNNIQFANEHFARLWKGMKLLQFDFPINFTPEVLIVQLEKLLAKNNIEKYARVRLTVFRAEGGLYDAINNKPNYIIECWKIDEATFNSNGLVIGIYKEVTKACNTLSSFKTNNGLPYILGAMYAKQQKWNDAIILNQYGNICETTIANIFMVKDNTVYTPPISEGCIEGVMRHEIISLLKKNNLTIIEKALSENDLLQADEVFTSNSIYIIKWVKAYGDKTYSNEYCKKIMFLFLEQNQ